ncbi:MAG: TaqI-like C-terminal specificity domain-containing protein, partial [Candidatus Aenigmatarchaeota archaeon]
MIGLRNDKKILKEIIRKKKREYFEDDNFRIGYCEQSRFSNNTDFCFDVYAIGYDTIINKIKNKGCRLDGKFEVRGGFMGYEYHEAEKYITNKVQESDNFKKIITPSLISPYRILWGSKSINIFNKTFTKLYLLYNQDIRKSLWTFFKSKKIVVRGIAKRTCAALDREGFALLVNIFGLLPKNNEDNMVLTMAILNSKLADFYHKIHFFLARIPEGSLRYPKPFWETFPIVTLESSNNRITSKIEKQVNGLIHKIKLQNKINNFPQSYMENLEEEF